MLYDPRWEKPQVQADPLSLDNLIAWLEQQPINKTFSFMNPYKCLLAQYAKFCDQNARPTLGESSYTYIINGKPIDLHRFMDIALAGDTFGAVLARAREFQHDRP